MLINNTGSVRVDLVGGTLDIEPLNLIIPQVVTLNVATSLKAEVQVSHNNKQTLEIVSEDYNQTYQFPMSALKKENFYNDTFFKEMNFIAQIVHFFDLFEGVTLRLKSGAPAGSGLGGSSAMGVTLFKAMLQFTNKQMPVEKIISVVKNIEAKILNKGMPGYQDYYPALKGGILALRGTVGGIECEQLFHGDLKKHLEKNIVLIYSGISRNSGINNWEVYKKFFDGDAAVIKGLAEIASVADELYQQIKTHHFENISDLIIQEGKLREKLFSNIVPPEISILEQKLVSQNLSRGIKMCGAGGGGCFLVMGSDHLKIKELAHGHDMQALDFNIESPIQ